MKQIVMKRRIPWAMIGVLLLLAVCIAPTLAEETPQLPHAFYGAVSIQGQPAPAGTVITAAVTNGGGTVVTEVTGFYGGMSPFEVEKRLFVHGTQGKQIPEGSPITFFVNGAPAEVNDVESQDGWMASYPFKSGGVTILNIRGSGTINQKTITASAGAGGSIDPSGNVIVNEGTDKTFNIVPDSGFVIDQVTVDGSPQGAVSTYTFVNVIANHTIQATFTQGGGTTFTINAGAGAGGSINPSGNVPVNEGTDKTFNIVPDSGFIIEQVTVDGSPQGAVSTYTFVNVIANHTIQATFTQGGGATFTINAGAGTGGSINPSGNVMVNEGTDKTFNIVPDSGFIIDHVTVDGSPQGAVSTYTFVNVIANHTIQATFTQGGGTTFTINASAGAGGSINPSGNVPVNEGTNKTFNIVPDSGFIIEQVTVDGSLQGVVSTYTFVNVIANHTIQATFTQGEVITYTIEASAGAGGSIAPNGSVIVNQGNDQSFSIIPDSEFSIEQVLVDGEPQGPISMYTFPNVTMDHTIQATFSQGGLIYFNQTLESGWNLFSTPVTLDPGHGTFEMIFNQSIDMIDVIYGWDNEQKIWYIPAGSTVPQPLDAYYVRVNSIAVAFIYPSPSVTEPPSRVLPSGLSLIGSAPAYEMGGFPAMPVDQALISIQEAPGNLTGYTIVISPDLNQPGWVYALGGPLEDILPYKGYWVVMENTDTLFGFSTTPVKNIG